MAEEQVSLKRLSLNQITIDDWDLKQVAEGARKAGLSWIAPWRDKVAEYGVNESRKIIEDNGLNISSLCRVGMFPGATEKERQENIDENKRAIEEAAELGTDVLVLVCGPAANKDLVKARQQVEEGIEAIVPFARDQGVKLAVEPLNPISTADRSVLNTLESALDIAEKYPTEDVGVIIDVFHVWWDPKLYEQIERATGRILGFHVSDWNVPITDSFKARKMMGDGVIQIPRIRKAVEDAGYNGPIEVEIMNQELWDMPGQEVIELTKERFLEYV